MATLPTKPMPTVDAIFRMYEEKPDEPRPHLGASLIGKPCERQLWYEFRWCITQKFEGRMLRLFQRGHRAEELFTKELRSVGVTLYTVDPSTGKQFKFSVLGGHVGGSADGVGKGFLEAQKAWHIVEFKTHNEKSFAELKIKGVQLAKPEHWSQMILYMRWKEVDRAFYLAENKNTDELYSERIHYDEGAAIALEAKAERVVRSPVPLDRISENPAWYQCKLCPAHGLCHGKKLPPVSCRTCVHATPEFDGDARWSCAYYKCDISLADQRTSHQCPAHLYIPALISYAKPVDANPISLWVEYEMADGRKFRNGNAGKDSYTSEELRSLDPALIGNSDVELLRESFDGRVVERVA